MVEERTWMTVTVVLNLERCDIDRPGKNPEEDDASAQRRAASNERGGRNNANSIMGMCGRGRSESVLYCIAIAARSKVEKRQSLKEIANSG